MLIDLNVFSPKTASGFIVLDGVNGAGKTTLQKALSTYLSQQSQEVLTTREPGATELGKTIRSLVLNPTNAAPDVLSELFLFAADRAEHVSKVIKPAIQKRQWILSDRYYYSTIAFQGYGRGYDMKTVRQLTSMAIQGVLPDLVLLLDLDPQVGLQRTTKRQSTLSQETTDIFESENLAFHTRIRDGFITMAKELPEQFAIINANQKPEQIFEQAKPYLDKLLLVH